MASSADTSDGIKTILLPTDGSEPAKSAARYAGELARVLGARIIAVHVAEPPFDYKPTASTRTPSVASATI